MELAGLIVGLVSITSAFAFNVRQLIAEFEVAGDEFEDIVWYFTITRTALSQLECLFKNNPLPSTQMLEYIDQVREHQKTLNSIEMRLRKIQQGLKSESFISRLAQKRDLLSSDLRRLTNKISALNGSLNLMATAYSCTVSCLVRDDIGRIEVGVSSLGLGSGVRVSGSKTPIFQNIEMDINFHYVETTETQRRNGYMGQDLGAISTLPADPPRGTRLAATTRAISTMEWDFDPLKFLQNGKIRGEPITGADLNKHTPDSKHLKPPPKTQAKETQQIQTSSMGSRVGQISHSIPRDMKDSPLDLLDMGTPMDEAWRMWDHEQSVDVVRRV